MRRTLVPGLAAVMSSIGIGAIVVFTSDSPRADPMLSLKPSPEPTRTLRPSPSPSPKLRRTRTPGPLVEYRRMLVNHEVGHSLGRGHRSCPSDGAAAPVMMQQTLGMTSDGRTCEPNPWPLSSELRALT